MGKTARYLKISIVVLVLFSALLFALISLTGAGAQLASADPLLLFLCIASFLFSILLWLFAWTLLVARRSGKPFTGIFSHGIASVFGSLTPIQLGSDLLRSIYLKDAYSIPMAETFAASMIVKGLKFSVLAVASTLLILYALSASSIVPALLLPLLSGLAVVLLAALLFLLPLKKRAGHAISGLFARLSRILPFLSPLDGYFRKYSDYLDRASKRLLALVFLLTALSWLLEFAALYFAFACLGIEMNAVPLAVLFILIAVLERTPIIPRGILLVELVGFAFLSFPLVSGTELSVAEIGSVLVVFDIARLIVPVLASIVFYLLWKGSGRKK